MANTLKGDFTASFLADGDHLESLSFADREFCGGVQHTSLLSFQPQAPYRHILSDLNDKWQNCFVDFDSIRHCDRECGNQERSPNMVSIH